ncbi:esterase [Synechococcus sp. HB1133]|uniref:esterase/lipase family protein n=1 Tax=unclassified Synechococcus TaxID=2626047 RepID=UPI00140ADD45|nr:MULTISPECIES: esterase [unclassified Synechococcus]MCB4395176.1 esterase [Synechococcus sp. PH41509]MCB4422339.1 esterase [Synechococcus sp. HB1133]MCB4429557.1 esterase [Synechococcus sp. HBA1120]NHI81283.1 esterase [Synechococcus sp. HB1133]
MSGTSCLSQPVVILGGFLITDEAYRPLADWIHQATGAPVRIVPASRLDWLATSWGFGWCRLLDRVDFCVRELQCQSPTERVTLIGHSSGGVMLRPYLVNQTFLGRCFNGATRCNRLITLGSPHQAMRATPLRARVDRAFPGCPEADHVDYVAVAGRLDPLGSNASTFSTRTSARSYRQIMGDPDLEGDGLVPVQSALLRDARWIELSDTAHGGLFGQSWYGSTDRIDHWWSQLGD